MHFVQENTVHRFRSELSPFVVNVCALFCRSGQAVVGFRIKMSVLALFDNLLLGFANEMEESSTNYGIF